MAADLATLGIRLTNAQAVADAKATGAALEEMGVKGETAARKIAGSSNPVTTAIKQQAIDYTQLTARASDFARAGASAAQVSQMAGVSMAEAAAAVKMYSGAVAKAEIDVVGLKAAQAQLAMANMVVGESAAVAGSGMTGMNTQMLGGHMHAMRLSMGLSSLVGSLTGTRAVFSQLGSTMSSMFIGMWQIVAVLGAIAAASFVWNKMTEGAHALKKETDDVIESLRKVGETKWDVATHQMKLAVDRVGELHTKLEQLTGDLKTMATLKEKLPGIFTLLFPLNSLKEGQAADTGSEITKTERAIRTAKLNLSDLDAERIRSNLALAMASWDFEKGIIADREAAQKKAADERKRTAAEEAKVAAQRDTEEAVRLKQMYDAAWHHEEDLRAARKLNLVPESAVKPIPGLQYLTSEDEAAAKEIEARNKKMLNEMQRDLSTFFSDIFVKGIKSFGDFFSAIKDMFLKMIAELMAANLMKRLAPILAGMFGMATPASAGAQTVAATSGGFGGQGWMKTGGAAVAAAAGGYMVGQSMYDNAYSDRQNRMRGGLGGAASGAAMGAMIAGPVGAAVGAIVGFTAGVLGSGAAAKKAAKELQGLQDALKLSFEDLRAKVSGDTLGQALAANSAELKKFLLTINAALPGGKNEAERNKQRAEATSLYGDLAAQITAAVAQALQYKGEDYQVRYLSATGHTKEAADLAEKNKAERERADLVKSFGDVVDATEQAVLTQYDMTAAAEAAAYALGTLSTSALNVVEGYRLQATIFAAMNPRGPSGSGGGPGVNPTPWVPPYDPSSTTGGSSSGGGGDLTVPVILNGREIGRAVLKDFQGQAQAQFGESSQWQNIQ